MKHPTINDLRDAGRRIKEFVHTTDTIRSRTFTERVGRPLFLKLENLQRAGSFKVRGALTRILSLTDDERQRGVVCASMGNHAQGVALGCKLTETKATVVMPERATPAKVAATEGYGAQVELVGNSLEDAVERAREIEADRGATFIHPFEDPAVICGQGTVALELLEALPDVATVLVPIGGGGLASGVAIAFQELRPDALVVGVQAAGVDTLSRTLEQGRAEERDVIKTIADGIAVKSPGKLNIEIMQHAVHEVWTVDDEEIAETILLLLERSKMVVEGAGAASLAAALKFKDRLPEGPVACIISGGNIDVSLMDHIIARGLVQSRRLIRLELCISDQPGSLAALLEIIAGFGASVVDLHQYRMRRELRLDEIAVEVELETSGPEVVRALRKELRNRGYRLLS